MSDYIERGALIAFVREARKNLPKESKDFFTRDEMLLNFQQYLELRKAADVEPVVRCKDCIHCVPLDAHADGVYGMHCLYQRGEEVRNVWHKFKKYYKDYSIVEGNSFCDQGERGAHMERSGSGE